MYVTTGLFGVDTVFILAGRCYEGRAAENETAPFSRTGFGAISEGLKGSQNRLVPFCASTFSGDTKHAV